MPTKEERFLPQGGGGGPFDPVIHNGGPGWRREVRARLMALQVAVDRLDTALADAPAIATTLAALQHAVTVLVAGQDRVQRDLAAGIGRIEAALVTLTAGLATDEQLREITADLTAHSDRAKAALDAAQPAAHSGGAAQGASKE